MSIKREKEEKETERGKESQKETGKARETYRQSV
jgi:hypothetical protein